MSEPVNLTTKGKYRLVDGEGHLLGYRCIEAALVDHEGHTWIVRWRVDDCFELDSDGNRVEQ